MPIGGSARTLLVGLGFAAAVLLLLWAPVGAGEDRVDVSPPAVTSPTEWISVRIDRHGGDWSSSDETFDLTPLRENPVPPDR